MQINKDKAKAILEEESVKAKNAEDLAPEWLDITQRLDSACDGNNLTFIAFLGTALLAKATNIEVDPTSLKAKLSTPGAYSARSLAQHVLTAHAPRLGINLGVKGREPLNNQPFFGKDYVNEDFRSFVHPQGQAAFDIILEGLQKLVLINSEYEARKALRSFLSSRIIPELDVKLVNHQKKISITLLKHNIKTFIHDNGENGKRAQAVAGALLQSLFNEEIQQGKKEILSSKVHDPDRNFPGDVAIIDCESNKIEYSFEVRDKPVEETDAHHFVVKVIELNCKIGIVAVNQHQTEFDTTNVVEWAWNKGVILIIYFGWERFIEDTIFWSSLDSSNLTKHVESLILDHCLKLEVSNSGLLFWKKLVEKT